MDARLALEKLSQQASLYIDILNGRIDRNLTSRRPLTKDTADIYRGTLRPKGTRVAVKTIHAGPPSSQEAIERVVRAIHTWSKLHHENILPLLGITTDFSLTVSLIFRWREKGPAIYYVQDRSIDPRSLLVGIAQGLYYLHNHESGTICHGDLRGYNVVVADDGRALLTDFGFSSLINSSFTLPVGTHHIGSVNWTAPEGLEDFMPTVKQDVWAYGMTALELFTRNPPFHEIRTITGIMRRIMSELPDRPSPESTCSRLTDEWWGICTSCWSSSPSERPDIADILVMLRNLKG